VIKAGVCRKEREKAGRVEWLREMERETDRFNREGESDIWLKKERKEGLEIQLDVERVSCVG
jgi:hypothetical protein